MALFREGPFILQTPMHFFYTDASHYGWGAHLELMRLSFHGCWSEDLFQYTGNNGHSFHTEESHKIYTLEIQYIAVRYFAISSISRIVRGPQIYHAHKKKKNK